ncbi:MAG TPA: YigZ family protein [Polyangia bacterium]|nr:YigZ family protein [Polyangia bacterium]
MEPGVKLALTGRYVHEREIKRSRFVAVAFPAESPVAALEGLERERERDATHNCWAYRVGELYRFSDDGEPAGTAGRPILAAIDGRGLDRTMVVVIRHFGGIKLGAGGLARAYGGTAAACLRGAPCVEVHHRTRLVVEVPFDAAGAVYKLIDRHGATRLAEDFRAEGVVIDIEIDDRSAAEFRSAVLDATRGRAVLTERA